MGLPRIALVTAREYQQLPADGPRFELIDGELIMAPAPELYHQDVSSNLQFIIRKYLEKRRIGVLYNAPCDVYLNDINVAQPDLMFVSKERRKILAREGIRGAPDLVIEISSPSTVQRDKKKRRIYAACGVAEYWYIDTTAKTVAVYYLQEPPDKPAFVKSGHDSFISPLLPGLRLRCAKIFAAWQFD